MTPVFISPLRPAVATLCALMALASTGCDKALLPVDTEYEEAYAPIAWKGAYEDVEHIKAAVTASAIVVPTVGSSSSIEYDIPDALVASAAARDIVLLGEQHWVLEHTRFSIEFVKRLHAEGFRVFVCEHSHALSVIYDEYVQLKRDSYPQGMGRLAYEYLEAFRAFNQTLPEAERLHVLAFDVNHDISAYWAVIDDSALYRSSPLFTELFALPNRFWDQGYPGALENIASTLEAEESQYRSSFGDEGYTKLVELTACERKSYLYRAGRSAMVREDSITENIEALIARYGKIIVGMGSAHAEKKPFMKVGDNQGFWVGVRLQAKYGNRLWTGCFLPIRGSTPMNGGDPTCEEFDSYEECYPSDLMRIIPDLYPNQTVYLPFTGEPFTSKKIGVNNDVYVPAEVYDALVLYPYATSIRFD
jgi:hypothetical protein